MTQELKLDGNSKMDWFFTEYVYGTQLPSYQRNATVDAGADGGAAGMLVPIDLELPSGRSSWEELILQATARSMRRFLGRA
jgi:hypothetical protein